MRNEVKRIDRLSYSTLEPKHVDFFHKLVVAIENDKKVKEKVIKNFNNFEVTNLINEDRPESITINPLDYPAAIRSDEVRFTNHKGNKAYSLLCHLRNAFAHNRIQVFAEDGKLIFQDEYNKKINMIGECSFAKLQYLVETILGEHNMTQEEIRNYKKRSKKNKRNLKKKKNKN